MAALSTSSRARVTTNIVGGLGNQLFLVANLLATAQRNRVRAVLPHLAESSSNEAPRPTYWDSIFASLPAMGVEMVQADDPGWQQSLAGPTCVLVPERRPVGPISLDPRRDVLYNMVGFFQSEAFFGDHALIHDAVPSSLHALAVEHLQRHYTTRGGGGHVHRVGLHVRRGDYLRLPDVFAKLSLEGYYDAAVRQLLGGLLHAKAGAANLPLELLVFCEEDMYADEVCRFFNQRYGGVQAKHVHPCNEQAAGHVAGARGTPREVLELLMMAHCDDVVMANSSFSWWGAYLNRRPLRRVVAPSRWFVQHPYPQSNHLYCPGWVLL